jgi:hypothetical protein
MEVESGASNDGSGDAPKGEDSKATTTADGDGRLTRGSGGGSSSNLAGDCNVCQAVVLDLARHTHNHISGACKQCQGRKETE